MSSHSEVIHVYIDIDIDFDLIDAARDECNDLNLNITDSFKIFRSIYHQEIKRMYVCQICR